MATKLPFSGQLRRAIERSDLSRYQISKQTGIAQSILSRFVRQGAGLSIESIDRLCDCLNLELVSRRRPRAKKG